jgi:hypothetical protein
VFITEQRRVKMFMDTCGQHFPGNLAILLKSVPQVQGRTGERKFYALALVDEETKARGPGERFLFASSCVKE